MLDERSVIHRGTILMKAKPFVYILCKKYRTVRCDHCLKRGEIHKCIGCEYVYYCNRVCQKSAWKVHKSECKNLKRCQPLTLTDTARIMARIITKFHNGEGNEKGYYMVNKYRVFNDMMSHSTEIKQNTNRLEHLVCIKYVLKDYFGKDVEVPEFKELLEIYGRLNTNTFHISDSIDNVAIGIYLGPSILNHSCSPNALVTFEGTTLYIRSLENFSSVDWSKIRISYRDLLQSTETRKKELLETYNFICKCDKCEQPDLKSNAAACPNSSCKNYCQIENKKCSKCGQLFDDKFKRKFREALQFTDSNLTDMTEKDDMELIRECLKKQAGVLHDMNVKRIKTVEAAVHTAINLMLWEEVESYAVQLIPGYIEYYTKYDNIVIDLYLTLGKVQVLLQKNTKALKTLTEAKELMKITHGEKHTLYTDVLMPMLSKIEFETMMYNLNFP